MNKNIRFLCKQDSVFHQGHSSLIKNKSLDTSVLRTAAQAGPHRVNAIVFMDCWTAEQME